MLKRIGLLSTLAFSLSLNTMAFANIKDYNNSNCPHQMMMEKLEKKLNLTEEQTKQIKAIKEDSRSQMKDLYEQKRALKKEMRALVTSDKIDESKLNDIIEKKKELVGKKTKLKIETKNKIYNILNDEQKEKFSEVMENWEQKRMEHMKEMKESSE